MCVCLHFCLQMKTPWCWWRLHAALCQTSQGQNHIQAGGDVQCHPRPSGAKDTCPGGRLWYKAWECVGVKPGRALFTVFHVPDLGGFQVLLSAVFQLAQLLLCEAGLWYLHYVVTRTSCQDWGIEEPIAGPISGSLGGFNKSKYKEQINTQIFAGKGTGRLENKEW